MSDIEANVALRLRAMMVVLEIPSNRVFGEMLGTTASAVNNWISGYNLPRVPEMITLCEKTGATLDWIYRGSMGSMNIALAAKVDDAMKSRR